ncbi:hypothetical protein CEP45_00335 [Mergibacter septicus]|uniref:DUF3413 domain-containing protein n=1 Tax=Mergibacter septicus TaxID=221402 RepID=UPI001C763B37|nr:DUF3413 domain-containing protein [Mergibacter septicus]QDJ12394.1 hypothetical protein CEP45_00335 [Mergibacter septicus]
MLRFQREKIYQNREEISRKITWGHWFAFFNIIWAIIIGSRYAFLSDWPSTFLGRVYFFISILGHFSFIVFAFYLLLIFPLSFIIKNNRTFRGVSVIIATLSITVLLMDTEIYKRFYIHLSSMVWDLVVNPDNGELSRNWQLFFTPMPIILLVQMLFSHWSWQKQRSLERQKWIKPVSYLFVFAFIGTHLIYAWADATFYRPITAQRANLPLSYPLTARSLLEKTGLLDRLDLEAKSTANGRNDAYPIEYPKRTLHYASGLAQQPNILLINLSGLRYDAITAKNMPELANFATTSANFTRTYAAGNDPQRGLVGILYSLSGSYLDSILSQRIEPVFLQHIAQLDYQREAFFSGNQSHSLAQLLSFTLPTTQLVNDPLLVKHWQEWYQHLPENRHWFSLLNFNLSQAVETKLKQQQSTTDKLSLEQTYQQVLVDTDQLLAQILTTLGEELEHTLIIITADVGYDFNATSVQLGNFSPNLLRVPLLIHWQSIKPQSYQRLSSTLDIVPTLLQEVFHIENPTIDYALGKNLFSDDPAGWRLASNNRWHVIITTNGDQYQIDLKGNYYKYNQEYQEQRSSRPPLGLFLSAFGKDRSFIEK